MRSLDEISMGPGVKKYKKPILMMILYLAGILRSFQAPRNSIGRRTECLQSTE